VIIKIYNSRSHNITVIDIVTPPHSFVTPSLSSSPLSSSFTLLLQAQNLPFQQIFPKLIDLWYPSKILGLDRIYHASRFIFSSFFLYFFLFVPCGRRSWLHVGFLVHVTQCRIVSYISYVWQDNLCCRQFA